MSIVKIVEESGSFDVVVAETSVLRTWSREIAQRLSENEDFISMALDIVRQRQVANGSVEIS